jgi:hypothetical protein
MKYVLLRYAVYTPKEERLKKRYRKATAYRIYSQDLVSQVLSTHAKESKSLQKASKWAQRHVIVLNGKCGRPEYAGSIAKLDWRLFLDVGVL